MDYGSTQATSIATYSYFLAELHLSGANMYTCVLYFPPEGLSPRRGARA
jgi:hypothetical protein